MRCVETCKWLSEPRPLLWRGSLKSVYTHSNRNLKRFVLYTILKGSSKLFHELIKAVGYFRSFYLLCLQFGLWRTFPFRWLVCPVLNRVGSCHWAFRSLIDSSVNADQVTSHSCFFRWLTLYTLYMIGKFKSPNTLMNVSKQRQTILSFLLSV